MAEGKQIRLFLIDGTFSGLVTAEIMNWTGHVFKGSRSELGRIYQREEAREQKYSYSAATDLYTYSYTSSKL